MLAELSVARICDAVASTEPVPGAGAAGAVALAMALACARKAVRLSLKHRPGETALTSADGSLEAFGEAALAGADEDAERFATLIEALHRRKDEGGARAAPENVAHAAQRLVDLGTALIDLGERARALIREIQPVVAPSMAGDLSAAVALIDANRAIQARNVAESRDRLDPEPR